MVTQWPCGVVCSQEHCGASAPAVQPAVHHSPDIVRQERHRCHPWAQTGWSPLSCGLPQARKDVSSAFGIAYARAHSQITLQPAHTRARIAHAQPDLVCFVCSQLTRLELLSYEDVSDAELAPLAGCTALKHLYLDSLFIKQVRGRVTRYWDVCEHFMAPFTCPLWWTSHAAI